MVLSLIHTLAEERDFHPIEKEFKFKNAKELNLISKPNDPSGLSLFTSSTKYKSRQFYPLAIHACIGIVNILTVTVEYGLLSSKNKPYNHLFTSMGLSRLSFWRQEGYGIEIKAGGQFEILEFNVGAWLTLDPKDPFTYNYHSNTIAIQLGIRTRSIHNRGFFRCGVGYPDGVYLGGGVRL